VVLLTLKTTGKLRQVNREKDVMIVVQVGAINHEIINSNQEIN
jgi:hypothetical protein